MARPYHHLFKILVVGDPSVDKEDLMKKFEEDKHSEDPFVSTIGIPFRVRDIRVGGQKVRLQLWESTWDAAWDSLTSVQDPTRAPRGMMVVYDVTHEASYETTRRWLQKVMAAGREGAGKVVVLLVGNNGHCHGDDRQVTWKRGKELGAEAGLKFLEVSPVSGLNVEETLISLTTDILAKVS
ncbi:hypothetical protein Pmani_016003 [Petrolisthes manimaculis]|uniref:Uncharacterized protein n=1 Tax=Petrolisthes manimaculis TaxID=1843537 RepID=A0AAE1PR17_9EUCA|nr:hypothetical protein Pmani_016003 [Petrolisthes manimaculis]